MEILKALGKPGWRGLEEGVRESVRMSVEGMA